MRYEDSGLTETIAADSDEDNSFKAQCEVGWYASREREESSVRSEATSVRSKATSDVDGEIRAGNSSGSSGVAHSGVGSGAMTGRLVYGRGNNHTDVAAPFLPAVMTKVSYICQCLWKSSCV